MYLVIDIGATKTLIALFSKHGRVTRRVQFPTAQGVKTFRDTLTTNLQGFQKYALRSVTVAVPGVVQKDCSVRFGNRNWGDVDILGWIKKLFNCPIYLENDANLGAIYEAYGLPGRVVYLTFSTGIGGGVVEDGKLVAEEFEPGHKIYEYGGVKAEWEDLAAASAIERIYHVDLATELRGRKVLRDVAARIYLGMPDIASEYRPDTIVIGGAMGKIYRLFAKYLPRIPGVKFKTPKRPRESVIYGGYLYGLEHDALAEYPEDLLRGTPVTKVMLKRAKMAGREVGKMARKARRKVGKMVREIGPQAKKIGRKFWKTAKKARRKAREATEGAYHKWKK